jgi:hypothetical protein
LDLRAKKDQKVQLDQEGLRVQVAHQDHLDCLEYMVERVKVEILVDQDLLALQDNQDYRDNLDQLDNLEQSDLLVFEDNLAHRAHLGRLGLQDLVMGVCCWDQVDLEIMDLMDHQDQLDLQDLQAVLEKEGHQESLDQQVPQVILEYLECLVHRVQKEAGAFEDSQACLECLDYRPALRFTYFLSCGLFITCAYTLEPLQFPIINP